MWYSLRFVLMNVLRDELLPLGRFFHNVCKTLWFCILIETSVEISKENFRALLIYYKIRKSFLHMLILFTVLYPLCTYSILFALCIIVDVYWISDCEAVHPLRHWKDLKHCVSSHRRCFIFTRSPSNAP